MSGVWCAVYLYGAQPRPSRRLLHLLTRDGAVVCGASLAGAAGNVRVRREVAEAAGPVGGERIGRLMEAAHGLAARFGGNGGMCPGCEAVWMAGGWQPSLLGVA